MRMKQDEGYTLLPPIVPPVMFLIWLAFMILVWTIVPGCASDVPGFSGCMSILNEAYAAGYDEGYEDATSDDDYQGNCFGYGCESDSDTYWHDEGYDDGYEAGGGVIPEPPGEGEGDSDEEVCKTLPGGSSNGKWLFGATADSDGIATVKVNGVVKAQKRGSASYSSSICGGGRGNCFLYPGDRICISSSSGPLGNSSFIAIWDPSDTTTPIVLYDDK